VVISQESMKLRYSSKCLLLSDETLTIKQRMHNARGHFACTKLLDTIYVFGGLQAERSAERYDIKTNLWTELPEMLTSRVDGGACPINESAIMLCGGSDHYGSPLLSLEIYDIKLEQWCQIRPILPVALRTPWIGQLGDHSLIILGGVNLYNKTPNNRVWILSCRYKSRIYAADYEFSFRETESLPTEDSVHIFPIVRSGTDLVVTCGDNIQEAQTKTYDLLRYCPSLSLSTDNQTGDDLLVTEEFVTQTETSECDPLVVSSSAANDSRISHTPEIRRSVTPAISMQTNSSPLFKTKVSKSSPTTRLIDVSTQNHHL